MVRFEMDKLAFSCLPYTASELENATHQEELPPARREVFMLYWKSGLNYREIAEQLDISEKTVATQVHRSLDFLRDKLGTIAFSVSLFLHHI